MIIEFWFAARSVWQLHRILVQKALVGVENAVGDFTQKPAACVTAGDLVYASIKAFETTQVR